MVVREAGVLLRVNGEVRSHSLVIKVLPTGDVERRGSRQTFHKLLRFSKEVQVYLNIAGSVNRCAYCDNVFTEY